MVSLNEFETPEKRNFMLQAQKSILEILNVFVLAL
jgi:hypothetical protein